LKLVSDLRFRNFRRAGIALSSHSSAGSGHRAHADRGLEEANSALGKRLEAETDHSFWLSILRQIVLDGLLFTGEYTWPYTIPWIPDQYAQKGPKTIARTKRCTFVPPAAVFIQWEFHFVKRLYKDAAHRRFRETTGSSIWPYWVAGQPHVQRQESCLCLSMRAKSMGLGRAALFGFQRPLRNKMLGKAWQ
jgi:hypothetical protein